MTSQAILNCLPLLADILGKAYGVTVEIGGDDAYTTGKVIRLPSLPATGDPTFLGLVRGYIDHESAHVRHTDFAAMNRESLTPLEQHIWNIFEDWRVEQRLASQFPGCRQNFRWLIRHLFLTPNQPQRLSVRLILDWLLLTVRSWEVAELVPICIQHRSDLDHLWPGLRFKLEGILTALRGYCPDSLAALNYARQVVACLANTAGLTTSNPGLDLQSLLQAQADDLPADLGETLRRSVGKGAITTTRSAVATVGTKSIRSLSAEDLEAIAKVTAGLQARLVGKLQASRLVRQRPARTGKLDPRRLCGILFNQPKIFLAQEHKQDINTSVHILLDCSSSMQDRITLACQVCATAAQALIRIGIPTGITAFPGNSSSDPTVVPLLGQRERFHSNLLVEANGMTPLTESLWWVLQRLIPEPEERKIILIITDGAPNNPTTAKQVIQAGHQAGVELYGLGINAPAITNLLPRHSITIDRLNELPKALFGLLEQALILQERTAS